ncbi:HYR domain-containing protein, partial [Bacteroidales bacterium OttesenSCG-928-J16]|nr:HYR domain-containing protein [Bacteroidales bacterium OttesenSCG-928-J16]
VSGNIVTGIAAGEAKFIFTDANGCSDTTRLIVNGAPQIFNDGAEDICVGSTLTLSTVNPGAWTLSQEGIVTLTQGTQIPNSVIITGVGTGGSTSATVVVGFTDNITKCVNSIEITVHEVLDVTITDKFCFGDATGIVTLIATGGSGADYSYYRKVGEAWIENTTAPTRQFELAAGGYEFKVTDSFGCEKEMSHTLSAPTAKTTVNVAEFTHVSCEGTSDGTIIIVASGGQGIPYQHAYSSDGGTSWSSWTNFERPVTRDTIRNLAPGVYIIKVRDKSECESSVSASVTINNNSAPVFSGCFTEEVTTVTDEGQCYAGAVYSSGQITVSGYPAPSVTYALYEFDGDGAPIEPPFQTGTGTGYNYNFPIGKTRVVISASNICDAATCSFDVVVTDNQEPNVHCKVNGSITKIVDSGQTYYTASNGDLDAIVTDNCASSELIYSYTIDGGTAVMENTLNGHQFSVGNYTIVWSVADGAGLTGSCSFTLTVTSGATPVIVCANDDAISGDAKAGTTITLYKGATPLTTSTPITADASGQWSVDFEDITGGLAVGDQITATLTENGVESAHSALKTVVALFSCAITDFDGNVVNSVLPQGEYLFQTAAPQGVSNTTYHWSLKQYGAATLDATIKNGIDNDQGVVIRVGCHPFTLELTVNYDGCISECSVDVSIIATESPEMNTPICAASPTVSGIGTASVPVKLYRIEESGETLLGTTTSGSTGAWSITVTSTLAAGDRLVAKTGVCELGVSDTATVSALPDTPVFKEGVQPGVCDGEELTVSLMSAWFEEESVSYNFYTDPSGTILANLPIKTNYAQQQVYTLYARAQNADCESLNVLQLIISVYPLPAAPTLKLGADQSVCDGETINETLLQSLIVYNNTEVTVEFYKNSACTEPFTDIVTDYSTATSHDIYAIARNIETNCATAASGALKISIAVDP